MQRNELAFGPTSGRREMAELSEDQMKQECWTKRFFAFGTAKIFERRARALAVKRRVLLFLGLASPLVIGGFAAAFTLDSPPLKSLVIPIAGLVGLGQLVMSLWALIARWDDEYAYALGAARANTRLAADCENLANGPIARLRRDIERLREQVTAQEIEDTVQHITDKEKRFAMRSALYQYRSKCPVCGIVPESMRPTACETCGHF